MKLRLFIFLLALYSSFASTGSEDELCLLGNDHITVTDASSIEIITTYKHSNEYAFEIFFPETYEGYYLNTAVVYVGGLENPNLELELKLRKNGDKYSAIFTTTADWKSELQFQGWYGPSICIRLVKTYENT